MAVPEVLLSGDHAEIERWRREAARGEDPPQPSRPRRRARTLSVSQAGAGPLVHSSAVAMNKTDLIEQAYPAHRHAGVPSRRHRQGARAGGRGKSRARPGVPGRRDPPPGRRPPRDLHGAQDLVRGRRRAHVPGAFAVDRQARGREPRAGASRQALLPARAARQEGAHQGAPDRRREARRHGGGRTPRVPPRPRGPRTRTTTRCRPRGRRGRRHDARGRRAPTAEAAESEARRSRARRVEDAGRRREPADDDAEPTRRRPRPDPWPTGPPAPPPSPPQPDHRITGAAGASCPSCRASRSSLAIVIKLFVVQAFSIPSTSMEPTLLEGDRILVCRVCLRVDDVDRGDVIVFEGPDGAEPDRGVVGGALHWLGETLGVAEPAARGLRQAGGGARRGTPSRSIEPASSTSTARRSTSRTSTQPVPRAGLPTDDGARWHAVRAWATIGATRAIQVRPAGLHRSRAGRQGDRRGVRAGLAAVSGRRSGEVPDGAG